MRDGAILANAGHFDVEIDVRALAAETALFSTDGASSSTKKTISVSPAWPRRI